MTEEKNKRGWPLVHMSLSTGSRGELGIELYLTTGRPLTAPHQKIVNRAMMNLQTELDAETARTDPENIAWKERWLKDARAMFASAGILAIYVKEIDNKYCGPKCCPHRVWLHVTTSFGVVEIGWRKRVMVVDWSMSDVTASAESLFAKENTTKEERMIHAWGYDKGIEYLKALLSAASFAPLSSTAGKEQP